MKDISLHILDLVQNSVAAQAARIAVSLRANAENDILRVSIEDNGIGMDRELLERVTDPFATTRTTRRVGLGIPLMKASAERAAGSLRITSEKGKGTKVDVCFRISNIDRPPLGDLAGIMTDLIISGPDTDMELLLEGGTEDFRLSSSEIKKQLGDVPITEYAVIVWIKEYLNEGIKAIFGGVLNEVNS